MEEKRNELTRVQLPAIIHLTRLGYKYFGKISEESAGIIYDADTNILRQVFIEQFAKLNPEHAAEAEQVLLAIKQELDNDDLGRSFYKRLTNVSPIRLIDFDHPENNVYHCTGEFTYKRDRRFRPDITVFINGMPLAFIEVKKPNNQGGMVAEMERMNSIRFPNKKFRRFINITQLMIFSNNMEYDAEGGIVPIQGVFYCTAARDKAAFSCFREENPSNSAIAPYNENFPYLDIDEVTEKQVLSDFNCQVLHHQPDYVTNKGINTPTNRTLTSMCSPERLLYLIKYGIAYVSIDREIDGKVEKLDQKHIMRYQQLFASLIIREKLSQGVKSGIIWHTQGSGKTALAYYLNQVLSDEFAKKNVVTKFYFIVDRLDLLKQAKQEFEARGLVVKTANSRADLMEQFRKNQALEGNSGQREITVVNIQRFEEDREKVTLPAYSTNLQRIFIIDEAHRGYKPEGSFLANLLDADRNSIKLALTGTPLLKEERESWRVFGDYLHTYYYDKSIQDGYTLKIIREDIETSYREKLSQIYEKLEQLVQKKDVKKSQIVEHENYVRELLRYIINDLNRFRIIRGDNTLGGMVICETSEQARLMYALFDEVQSKINADSSVQSHLKAGLILYDSDDKETREKIVDDFKRNFKIDILIVFNMLLTGFDAPRLKRLYLGRKLKDHGLLQALTRVNRPYKSNKYGYVVDFADIKHNFEETNAAYLRELNRFNDPEETGFDNVPNTYAQVIEDKDALIDQMKAVRQTLFEFTTDNMEEFSSEISTIEDKEKLLRLKKVLMSARDTYNIVRTFGDDKLKEEFSHLEIENVSFMISEVQRHINNINLKESFDTDDSTKQLVNEVMLDITFNFQKIGEEEMRLISGGSELNDKWRNVIMKFTENIDPDDPEYITLQEAFRQRFREHGFVIDNLDQFYERSKELDEILKKLNELQRKNNALLKKYRGDAKFARVHKRIREENERRQFEHKKTIVSLLDEQIMEFLLAIKTEIDQKVYDKNDILKKDAFFEQTVMSQITLGMDRLNFTCEREDRLFIRSRIARQYLSQYNATYEA